MSQISGWSLWENAKFLHKFAKKFMAQIPLTIFRDRIIIWPREPKPREFLEFMPFSHTFSGCESSHRLQAILCCLDLDTDQPLLCSIIRNLLRNNVFLKNEQNFMIKLPCNPKLSISLQHGTPLKLIPAAICSSASLPFRIFHTPRHFQPAQKTLQIAQLWIIARTWTHLQFLFWLPIRSRRLSTSSLVQMWRFKVSLWIVRLPPRRAWPDGGWAQGWEMFHESRRALRTF